MSPQTVHPAGTVTYVLVVHNHGQGKARHVMLEDPSPSGVIFRTAHASHGHCTINRALVCHLGDLPGGGQALVQVTATIAADAHSALVNRAGVWTNRREANESNDAAASTVHVTPPPGQARQAAATGSGRPAGL